MTTINMNPTKSLIDLCDTLRSADLIKYPIGWTTRPIEWIMKLNPDGTVRRIDKIEKIHMSLPDLLTSRSSGIAPMYLHDTFKYFDGTAHSNKMWECWRTKHLQISAKVDYPESFLNFISKSTAPITQELYETALTKVETQTKDELRKVESSFYIIELPDGTFLHECEGVKDYWKCSVIVDWQNMCSSEPSQQVVYGESSVTGNWGILTPFHAAFGKAVPGAQAGAKFGSIDVSAASYYHHGMEGAYSTPMTIEETFKLRDSIEYLASRLGESSTRYISNGNKRIRLWNGNMSQLNSVLIAWGEEQVIELFGFDDLNKIDESKVIKIIELINGDRVDNESDVDWRSSNQPVYFMSLNGATGGRVAITDFWASSTPELATRLAAWHKNTMLLNADGDKTYPGFFNLMSSLNFTKKASDKRIATKAVYELGKLKNIIMRGYPIPDRLIAQSITAMRTMIQKEGTTEKSGKKTYNTKINLYGKTSPFRAFKAFMEYNGQQFITGTYTMINNTTPEYKLGRMVIKLDSLQYRFEKAKGFGRQPGLSPQTKKLIAKCESNPINGLKELLKRKTMYGDTSSWGNSEEFKDLKSYMSLPNSCNFYLGIEEEYDQLTKNIKAWSAIKQSNDTNSSDE